MIWFIISSLNNSHFRHSEWSVNVETNLLECSENMPCKTILIRQFRFVWISICRRNAVCIVWTTARWSGTIKDIKEEVLNAKSVLILKLIWSHAINAKLWDKNIPKICTNTNERAMNETKVITNEWIFCSVSLSLST